MKALPSYRRRSVKTTNVKTLPARGRTPTGKKIVIDAAIKCFKQYGPHRTSMTDIAEAAGISRKTLYRMFEDRPSLVEQVLLSIFGVMRDKIAKRVGSIDDTRKALVDGILISMDVAREDKLFNEIIRKDTNYRAEQLMVRGNRATRKYMMEFWGPILNKGKQEGLIRPSLANDRIFEIMMSLIAVLLMRDDRDDEERRQFVEDLLEAVFTH